MKHDVNRTAREKGFMVSSMIKGEKVNPLYANDSGEGHPIGQKFPGSCVIEPTRSEFLVQPGRVCSQVERGGKSVSRTGLPESGSNYSSDLWIDSGRNGLADFVHFEFTASAMEIRNSSCFSAS